MPGDGDSSDFVPETVEQPGKKFTWIELSNLNTRDNAHVAYRGKVSAHTHTHTHTQE